MANEWNDYQLDPYQQATASTAKKTTLPTLNNYEATTGTSAQVGDMSKYDAKTGKSSKGILSRWMVDDSQLVESRMNDMLSKGSAYRDQAETTAMQQSNKRGLLNSSMAATAGYSAAIQSALPIAQQDAQTMATAGQYNTTQANTMSQFNAGQDQGMTLANMDAENAARQYGAESSNRGILTQAELTQQTNMANMDAQNAASQFNTQQTNTGIIRNSELDQENAQFNAQQQNAISEANAARAFDASTSQLQANVETFKAVTDQQTQIAMSEIEAEYNQLMQASASAADLYSQMMTNITNISTNKDMDADAKTIAIQNQLTMLEEGLATLSTVNELELGDILDFTTVMTGSTGAIQPTPQPADGSGQTATGIPAGAMPVDGGDGNIYYYDEATNTIYNADGTVYTG